jgi:hypothetical protein
MWHRSCVLPMWVPLTCLAPGGAAAGRGTTNGPWSEPMTCKSPTCLLEPSVRWYPHDDDWLPGCAGYHWCHQSAAASIGVASGFGRRACHRMVRALSSGYLSRICATSLSQMPHESASARSFASASGSSASVSSSADVARLEYPRIVYTDLNSLRLLARFNVQHTSGWN